MKTLKNFVQLIGNLGQDVELREFDSGSKKASFTLATNEGYTDKNGEKVEKTEWHNIVAWGKPAEWMKNSLKKGDQVMIQGQINYRKYEDKEGIVRYITEINTNDFLKINGK
ncbi:MAG TPA: single-stranded DNA-binding protein [Bacteroidetes bacterium]|nr:single-stranded DNA-binding protein [Bacteroidota bacterium]